MPFDNEIFNAFDFVHAHGVGYFWILPSLKQKLRIFSVASPLCERSTPGISSLMPDTKNSLKLLRLFEAILRKESNFDLSGNKHLFFNQFARVLKQKENPLATRTNAPRALLSDVFN